MTLIFGCNSLVDVFVILFSLGLVVYAYFQWNYQYWKRINVPYLKPTFPFGNRNIFGKAESIGEDAFNLTKQARARGWKYFGIYFGLEPFFVTYDLELLKCMLSKDFSYFTDRGIYVNERDDPMTANLVNLGGIKWRNLRTKLTPTFTSGKMKGMFQTLVACSSVFEDALKNYNKKKPIDIKEVLVCFTMDVIGSCAFGLECNNFKEPDSLFMKHGRRAVKQTSFEIAVELFARSCPNLARMLHVKITPKEVSKFFTGVVQKTIKYRENSNNSRNDFLQLLINIKDEGDGNGLSMNEIISQSFLFFLAGFETSSTTVAFTLFELSQHIDIQQKVREELFEVLKKYDNKLCYEAVGELVYMQQVIDESLRKYPPGPFLMRKSVKDYKVPGTDIILEKGTSVIISVKGIHYDEEIYENPEKFDPERFNPEQRKNRNPYSYIPFGEGPRNCIGMRFGLLQTKVALATILRNYSCKLNLKTKLPLLMDPKSVVSSTLGGIWLDLEEWN